MRTNRWIAGPGAALAASVVLATAPASATIASSVTAAKPAWSSSLLKSTSNAFKTASGSTATYTATVYLYRTTNTSISCSPSTGCSGTGLVQVAKTSWSVSVAGNTSYTLQAVSMNCAAQTTSSKQTRYYWTYTKVADAAGAVKASLSSSLSGTYC